MRKILITGITGFLASHVAEIAKQRGYEVVGNARSYTNKPAPDYLKDVQVYVIDSRDKVGMRAIIEQVDGVINLAGILGTKNLDNPREFYENNVFAALNVYDACLEFDVPVVQIAVGNHKEVNNYSNSKTAAERDLLMYARYKGLRGNVVRGLNVIGTRQNYKNTGKIIPTFIVKALRGENIEVYGGKNNCSIMDMVAVEDVANILLDVLENTDEGLKQGGISPYGNVFEAGTGIGINVWEIAQTIIAHCNSNSKIIEVAMRAGESEKSEVIARDPYPYQYSKFIDNIDKIIKYYRKEIKDGRV